MEECNESLEQLEEKIAEYEKQLSLVRNEIKKCEGIERQSDNEKNEQVANLRKLECDMIEVINLTQDLIKYKKKNEEANVSVNASASASAGVSAGTCDVSTANQTKRNEESQVSTVPVSVDVHESIKESHKLIGRTCSFLNENKKIYGLIENILVEKNIEHLVINIMGTNEKVMLPKMYIQLNEILSESAVTENNQFQALYTKDGQWYDCTINKKKGDTFFITYVGYNSSEYVKHDQVRIKRKKKVKEIITPAGYKIPENLIVKENDPLKVKLKKQKKRNALKKKQKNEIRNQELNNKAQQWRNFHQKTITKNKPLLSVHKKLGEENKETKNTVSNYHNIRRKYDGGGGEVDVDVDVDGGGDSDD